MASTRRTSTTFQKVFGNNKQDSESKPTQGDKKGAVHRMKYLIGTKQPKQQTEAELARKFGNLGQLIGKGGGGSVYVARRHSEPAIFAVKQFRDRRGSETGNDHKRKVNTEFAIASQLHHVNIIETISIISEKGTWYQVMDFAPCDLFAVVKAGRMSKREVACCLVQILNGVSYLHDMGIAHRDLKLDNVVVSKDGVMKIIDFGSAMIFKYPGSTRVYLTTGEVGSEAYMAPEAHTGNLFDPRAGDVWALAIMYCTMMLRRFPWRASRLEVAPYKAFVSIPGPEYVNLGLAASKTSPSDSLLQLDAVTVPDDYEQRKRDERRDKTCSKSEQPQGWVRGPLGVLRLLPRESRATIGRMLALDPERRPSSKEIQQEPWITEIPFCRQHEDGTVSKVEGHVHLLEPQRSQ